MAPDELSKKQLNEKIRVLLEENDRLSELALESTLMRKVSESLYDASDEGELLDRVLTDMAVLMNIPFCSYWRWHGGDADLIRSYASFTNENISKANLSLATRALAPLEQHNRTATWFPVATSDLCFTLPDISFESVENRGLYTRNASGEYCFFIFSRGRETESLEEKRDTLVQLGQLVCEKLDKLDLARQLYNEKNKYQSIFNYVPAAIVVRDEHHKVQDCNPVFEKISGYSKMELLGRYCTIIKEKPEDNPAGASASPGVNKECRLITKSGAERTIIKSTHILKGPDDSVSGTIESFVDISREKHLAELKDNVEKITRHDLRSPLTAILSSADLLLDDDTLTDEQRELVDIMYQSGEKMNRMLQNSLNLYKLEAGTYHITKKEYDMYSLIRNVVKSLRYEASNRHITVVLPVNHRILSVTRVLAYL